MKHLTKVWRSGAVALATMAVVGAAGAATIVKDNTSISNIPGISSFSTTGAEMGGMTVRAIFDGGTDQTLIWGATGASSGGVTGTGWGLSQSGDTFAGLWSFTMSTNLGQLTQLVLSGNSGLTVFDTDSPSFGTPDSAQGADFGITDGTLNAIATATYSDVVAVIPNVFVGDLYHVLTVTFAAGAGPRTDFLFRQDTDNDIRIQIPEPGVLGLVGLALAALGAVRARRKTI